MARYLVSGNYVGDGVKGLASEGGSGRRAAVEALVASLGGSLESFYFALGTTDVFIVVDMPDNTSAAAASLAANASGAVAVSVTVLLTPEELDAAAQLSPQYRPPGS